MPPPKQPDTITNMADTITRDELAVTQARDTKRLLLHRITEATNRIREQEQALTRAREERARLLQEAANSGLTTPGERQQAAGISKQHRQGLEQLPLPPRQPDPGTQDAYTPPMPFEETTNR